MKTVTICNNKGGTAKTTTAIAMLYGLKDRGYKVIGIDMDAQGNLSRAMDSFNESSTHIYDFLMNGVITVCHHDGIDVIPAAPNAIAAALKIMKEDSVAPSSYLLDSLKSLKGYDYCIIDTPGELGLELTNALMASDEVIIAANPEIFSAQGLTKITSTVDRIRERGNKKLGATSILLTKTRANTAEHQLMREVTEEVAKKSGARVFKTQIRNSTYIGRSQRLRESPFSQSKNPAAQDYRTFLDEFLAEKGE